LALELAVRDAVARHRVGRHLGRLDHLKVRGRPLYMHYALGFLVGQVRRLLGNLLRQWHLGLGLLEVDARQFHNGFARLRLLC
jgi:hypothetical protein